MQLNVSSRSPWSGFLKASPVLLLACALLIGCRKAEESAPIQEWVVQVGTQKVSQAVFEADWLKRQSQQERPIASADVVGGFVTDWQAYLAAGPMGLMEDPELQQALRRVVAGKVREKLSQSLSKPGPDAPIEAVEIEAAYRTQAQRWQRPPAWNIAWLVASVSPKAEPSRRAAVRARLEGYRRDIQASADPKATFAILCSNHSDDTATRYLRGELGWLLREQLTGRMGEAVAEEAVSLSATNRLSSVIESPTRMVLLMHLGYRQIQMRPLDEVIPQIRSEIVKRREEDSKLALAQELNRRVPVLTNQAVLGRLTAPAPLQTTPPAPSPMPRP
jgi:hypothetical protein